MAYQNITARFSMRAMKLRYVSLSPNPDGEPAVVAIFRLGTQRKIQYYWRGTKFGKAGSRTRFQPFERYRSFASLLGPMNRLIECVPNFSEGRDLAKVDALVDAMSGVAGAWVLDHTSDADHNRSVVTIAGKPEAVAEAAIRGAGKAAELIDMTRHTGVH